MSATVAKGVPAHADTTAGCHGFAGLIVAALQQCLDPTRPYALFDFPLYSNVGDSVIWQAQLSVLAAYFGRRPVLSCGSLSASDPLPHVSAGTQIILSGGGNLGDLWEHHQRFRERLIRGYPRHRIVQMPQSICFQHAANQARCREVFSAHPDLTLLVRDEPSLAIASSLHQGRTLLVPDVALALGPIRRPTAASLPIVALLRGDLEKRTVDDPAVLRRWHVQDWIEEPPYLEKRLLLRLRRFAALPGRWSRFAALLEGWLQRRLTRRRLQRGCQLLSRGAVVITDRLHAHVLCVLMNIPHVVLDNSYGKICSFRQCWTAQCSVRTLQASTLAEADRMAGQLLRELG